MKIAYFKNMQKLLNFCSNNTVAHIFTYNGYICATYYPNANEGDTVD